MNRWLVIGILGLLLVLIIFFAFSSSNRKVSGSIISGSSIIEKSSPTFNEKERYSKLQAELTCDLTNSDNTEGALNAINNLEGYLTKYGFDIDQFEPLQKKYEDDVSFQQLVIEEMENFCPEIAP